jgi:geranylgeranyl diphosphate synthase type II
MDKSPLRRGKPTVYCKWDENTAILSGDTMYALAWRYFLRLPHPNLQTILNCFNETCIKVCEGQQFDMEFESRDDVPMEEYMNMIGLKTGVLIACSAKMGALIAGASKEDCDNLYDYGFNLGLAFQVADDFLDAYGDEKVVGKPIGGDIVNAKKSWLTIRAMEKASDSQKKDLLKAMAMPVLSSEEKTAKITCVKGLYDALGVASDAQRTILDLNDKALESAAKVCSGVRYERLRRFADRLIGRTK